MLTDLQQDGPGGVSIAFPKDRYRLHAMVTSAGYDLVAGSQYDWHGLRRGEAPFALLQHTISGRGRLRVATRRFDVRAGQTMLLRFPQDNRYWLGRGDTWEFFWLLLNGREVLRVWREVLDAHGPVVRLPDASVDRLAGVCRAVCRGEAASPAAASTLAYGAAMVVAEALIPWAQAPRVEKRPAAIERAVSLCLAEPSRPLDVAELARVSGYSRYHFSRLFAQSQGVSPARYLLRLRVEEAARLLRAEPAPVKLIAQRCGFADPNYFTKVFHRFYGMTPRDFRRSGIFVGAPHEAGRSR